jgi:hypothetical protein
MKARHFTTAFVAVALLAAAAPQAEASGSYRVRPPQPRLQDDIDRALYALGQQVYDGKSKPSPEIDGTASDSQGQRLGALQQMLPARAARSKDLPKLAGRLSAQQLDALEYYVKRRFGKIN